MVVKRNKALHIVIFLVILAVLMTGVSWLVKPKGWEAYDVLAVKQKVNAMQEEPADSLDVLFAGDSESCDVISPVQLWGEYGFTSYNTGSSAQRICDGYAILEQEFKRQSPSLVVIEANTLFRKDAVYNSDDKAEELLEKTFPVTHYHSIYKMGNLPEWMPGWRGDRQNAERLKGFWLRTTSRPYRGGQDYMEKNKTASMAPDTENWLNKIYDLCTANGAEVLIIASPSPKNWTQGRHTAVEEWAQDHHVSFMDLNDFVGEIGIQWDQDSLDNGDHVNFSGSVKINKWLGKWIQEKYHLHDRRTEAGYDEWNSLYSETYEEKQS